MVAATIVRQNHGECPAQDMNRPLGVVTTQDNRHTLVSAFLTKHFGGMVGHQLHRPVGTVTARDHHALTTAHLCKLKGTNIGGPMTAPVSTICAGGTHIAEVRAFLVKFYSSGGQWGRADRPMPTITAKARLGIVTIHGVEYQIADIGMRMLEPHELLRAQFGRFASGYSLDVKKVVHRDGQPPKRVSIGKSEQVRLIGNSVCPEQVEAIVAANVPAFVGV